MFGQEAALLPTPPVAPAPAASASLASSVGFVGAATGLIYLHWSEDFARHAAGSVLGMSPAEIEMHGWEVVHDAIGEITNVTVGAFKNSFCDLGFPCRLTLPTIIRGHKLSIVSIKAATRHVFHFDCSRHVLAVDLQIKLD